MCPSSFVFKLIIFIKKVWISLNVLSSGQHVVHIGINRLLGRAQTHDMGSCQFSIDWLHFHPKMIFVELKAKGLLKTQLPAMSVLISQMMMMRLLKIRSEWNISSTNFSKIWSRLSIQIL